MNGTKIKTPLSTRARAWRRRYLPVAVWLLAVAGLIWLSRGSIQSVDAIAVVEQRNLPVLSLSDGKLRSLAVGLFDTVEPGQVLGVLDDTAWRDQMKVAQAELQRLRAELTAAERQYKIDLRAAEHQRALDLRREASDAYDQQQSRLDWELDRRRFLLDEEQAHLNLLERKASREANRAALQLWKVIERRNEELAGIQQETLIEEVRAQVKSLETAVREDEEIIAEAQMIWERTRQRREELDQLEVPELAAVDLPEYPVPDERSLEPLRAAIAVQEAIVDELENQRAALVLLAPMRGTVGAITKVEGETLLRGATVLEINASDPHNVVAYVDQSQIGSVYAEMDVMLYSRRRPRTAVKAKVINVGTQVERYPLRLRPDPDLPRYGLACKIGEVPTDTFLPGEVLDVKFLQ